MTVRTPLRTRLEENLGWGLLALLFIGGLLVLWPFVTAFLWASVLSYSSWPIYRRLVPWVGGRRTLAALLLSLAMVLVVLLPFLMVGLTLADNINELKAAVQRWMDAGPPSPPSWVEQLPGVGHVAAAQWQVLAEDGAKLLQEAKRFIEPIGAWMLKVGLKLGAGLLELALSILITFFLLRNGPSVAAQLTACIERIAGERGKHLLELAGGTVRGVVSGILGTSLAQGLMAGLGFLVAGVPGAGLLALLTFFLSVVPVGPPLVWLPSALWLFHQGRTGWGIFMLVWGVGVSTVDNFVKPWLISQGSAMPFILILFGVLGGALAFGFIGVFIGPTLLAVLYRLLVEWSAANRAALDPAKDSPASATIESA
jgi:predicted PurR-regulated permease PerM